MSQNGDLMWWNKIHLDSVVPHVGRVEGGRLVVHVLRHHRHPVGQALCASRPSTTSHAPADTAAPGDRLGVAAPRQPGLLNRKKSRMSHMVCRAQNTLVNLADDQSISQADQLLLTRTDDNGMTDTPFINCSHFLSSVNISPLSYVHMYWHCTRTLYSKSTVQPTYS